MADNLSLEKRKWNMSQIHSYDTTIEVKVRKELFKQGFRFRKNDKRYPGKPDIVLPKYHTVVFIHGCFWHRHEGCKEASLPKTNTVFWKEKFDRNVINDKRNTLLLEEAGWKVITVWECDIKKNFCDTMGWLVSEIKNTNNNS